MAIVILLIFLSYKFSEPLSDYKGLFLLMFQANDLGNLEEKKREHNRANIYNMAAIRDANLIIIRALTENNLVDRITTPRSATTSKTSLCNSISSEDQRILDSDPKRRSTQIFEQVLVEETERLLADQF